MDSWSARQPVGGIQFHLDDFARPAQLWPLRQTELLLAAKCFKCGDHRRHPFRRSRFNDHLQAVVPDRKLVNDSGSVRQFPDQDCSILCGFLVFQAQNRSPAENQSLSRNPNAGLGLQDCSIRNSHWIRLWMALVMQASRLKNLKNAAETAARQFLR